MARPVLKAVTPFQSSSGTNKTTFEAGKLERDVDADR